MALQRVFDIWIGVNGVAYSTQTAEIFRLLRAHYHGAPKGAFIICGANPSDVVPDDESLVPRAETVSIRGWKAMTNVRTVATLYGPPKFAGGDLVYVDFVPSVLERNLGQSSRALRQALGTLRNLKFLITESKQAMRTQRRVDGENTPVIRIKGEFLQVDNVVPSSARRNALIQNANVPKNSIYVFLSYIASYIAAVRTSEQEANSYATTRVTMVFGLRTLSEL